MTAAATPSSRPGTLEVDEAAAERALERSLTQSGALLLPSGVAEVQFGMGYARTEQRTPTLLLLPGGQWAVGQVEARGNDATASLSARIGLPRDMQFEFSLPYRSSRQSLVEPTGPNTALETRSRVSGSEDVSFGLAKTLSREQGWLPDVIGRVGWNTGSGSDAMGGGFRRLRSGHRDAPRLWSDNCRPPQRFLCHPVSFRTAAWFNRP